MADLADPTSPTTLGPFTSGNTLVVDGDWAYVLKGSAGLWVYSIADPLKIWDAGLIEIAFQDVATSGGLIYATSEADGLYILDFTPPEAVDLVPRNFALETPAAAGGLPIEFAGTIENLGPDMTLASIRVAFRATPTSYQGPAVELCDPLHIEGGLVPGTSVSLAGLGRTLYGPETGLSAGTYRVEVVVDEANMIAERRELNNRAVAAQELTVWPSANDVRPVAFDFAPGRIVVGHDVTLTCEVEYTGIEPSPASFWVHFMVSPNVDFSEPRWELCDSVRFPAGLDAGTTWPFTITRGIYGPPHGAPRGLYVVGVVLDPADDLSERDETNNILYLTDKRLVIDRHTATGHWSLYR